MRQRFDTRSSLSLRRSLIELNLQLEDVLRWSDRNGIEDRNSSIKYHFNSVQLPLIASDILLLEDRRFFKHRGAELRAIPRSIRRYLRVGRLGGVSTIEQQLIRTLCNRRERTFGRKSREVLLALLINLHKTKREILLAYLNCAYFGAKMHGVDSASLILFGEAATGLSPQKSAFIASLLPYPLPTRMSYWLRVHGHVTEPEDILNHDLVRDTWWAERVSKRMRYLERLRSKIKDSSYQ